MPIDGQRLAQERQKLCIWLESEKRTLGALPHEVKNQREQELEREFRTKLDRLYGEARHEPSRARVKLN